MLNVLIIDDDLKDSKDLEKLCINYFNKSNIDYKISVELKLNENLDTFSRSLESFKSSSIINTFNITLPPLICMNERAESCFKKLFSLITQSILYICPEHFHDYYIHIWQLYINKNWPPKLNDRFNFWMYVLFWLYMMLNR